MNVPKHLGIIPDGNRRFAKRLMLEPWKGHEFGAKKLKNICDWCIDAGISEVTFWALSTQNLGRPKEELDFLFDIFKKEFENKDSLNYFHGNKISVHFIGNLFLLPGFVQDACKKLENETKNYSNFKVNIALAYGGREDLVEAVKRISKKVETGELSSAEVNEKLINDCLDMTGNIDYVIRTGGEHRTSGFFIWQADYAEYCFIDKMFPEFEKEDFAKAIESFSERQRRFGK